MSMDWELVWSGPGPLGPLGLLGAGGLTWDSKIWAFSGFGYALY